MSIHYEILDKFSTFVKNNYDLDLFCISFSENDTMMSEHDNYEYDIYTTKLEDISIEEIFRMDKAFIKLTIFYDDEIMHHTNAIIFEKCNGIVYVCRYEPKGYSVSTYSQKILDNRIITMFEHIFKGLVIMYLGPKTFQYSLDVQSLDIVSESEKHSDHSLAHSMLFIQSFIKTKTSIDIYNLKKLSDKLYKCNNNGLNASRYIKFLKCVEYKVLDYDYDNNNEYLEPLSVL